MGVFFSFVTAVLFALCNIYSRKASKGITGLQAIVLTVTLNFLFFFPLGVITKYIQGTPWPDFSTILLFLLVGVLGTFLGRWGLYNSIALIGPSRGSLIKNSAPLFAILLAFLFFYQLPTWLSFIGIFTIMAGIWISGWKKEDVQNSTPEKETLFQNRRWYKGIILGVAAAFLFAAADIVRAVSIQHYSDIIIATGFSTLGAWLAMLVFLMLRGELVERHRSHFTALNKNLVLASCYAGAAQLTNFYALKMLFVPYVSALVATAPIWTAVLSYMMLRDDEKFGAVFWTSLGLITGGACLIIGFK
ncbi:DMT family transporter [Paenibacillus sp. EPM92]|uniref:DMT family transporter n=1 Tax=Paenibacillus sp. EPM92 TaxID=1561195 RepID=UPI001915E31C|nr:DMT family transporter [Paenibacillus sp. EPM92]